MRAARACPTPRRARSHLLLPVEPPASADAGPPRLGRSKPRYGPARGGELPRDDRAKYDPLRACSRPSPRCGGPLALALTPAVAPIVRILASPLRRCLLTNKVLPSGAPCPDRPPLPMHTEPLTVHPGPQT